MPYVFQTFSINQIHTAAQANQTEQNTRDHEHGVAGVKSLTTTEDAAAVLDAVSQVSFASSVAEETLYTKTIPGGTLGTTRGVILLFIGELKNNSGGNATVTVRIKFGTRTIHSQAILLGTDTNTRTWRVYVELFGRDTTSTQAAYLEHFIGTAGVTDTVGENIEAMPIRKIIRDPSPAQDSTVNQNLVVTVQWDVNSSEVQSIRRTARLLVVN